MRPLATAGVLAHEPSRPFNLNFHLSMPLDTWKYSGERAPLRDKLIRIGRACTARMGYALHVASAPFRYHLATCCER